MDARLRLLEQQFKPSSLTQIIDKSIQVQGVELCVKRDDLLHPIISGNKWRKLKYILNYALANNVERMVSMGGAYSNHLHALAFAGKALGLATKAFVRGECPAQFNPTLIDLQRWGMELVFVSRSDYRQLRNYKDAYSLPDLIVGDYWLPEGGASQLAMLGVKDIVMEIEQAFDVFAVACGTGTTMAGVIAALPKDKQVLGVAALKNAQFLNSDIQHLLGDEIYSNWRIDFDYHAGGFAKTTPQLRQFMDAFSQQQQLPLEPVYTGKLLFALYDRIKQGYFKPGQRILALHTGGLQGNRSLLI